MEKRMIIVRVMKYDHDNDEKIEKRMKKWLEIVCKSNHIKLVSVDYCSCTDVAWEGR